MDLETYMHTVWYRRLKKGTNLIWTCYQIKYDKKTENIICKQFTIIIIENLTRYKDKMMIESKYNDDII